VETPEGTNAGKGNAMSDVVNGKKTEYEMNSYIQSKLHLVDLAGLNNKSINSMTNILIIVSQDLNVLSVPVQ
jgi:hypothetical protein